MKKIFPLIIVSLFLSACAGLGGGTKQLDPLTITQPENLAGQSRVALGDFRVTFITFDKSSAKSTSPMFSSDSGYAQTTLRAKLSGISDEMMQAITDAAYQDFLAKLKQSGFSLVDESVLTGNAIWNKVKYEDSPKRNESSFKMVTGGSREDAMFAPTGRKLVEMNIGGALPYPAYDAARDLNIPVLAANYIVHFVYFGSETDYQSNAGIDFKGAEYSAEVSAGQGIQVITGSGVEVMRGLTSTFSHPNASVRILAPVVMPGAYGRSEDSTSGLQKAANAFSSVMGMVSGGSSSAKEINISADPALYKAKALQALEEANSRVIGGLAGAR